MQNVEIKETVVGLLAVTALIGLVIVTYATSRLDERPSLKGEYRLKAVFNRVDGLAPGAAVTVSGIRIGTVEAMILQPDYRAQLTLTIDERILLPSDTSAAIHTDGLFGTKFLTLDPGGADENLKEGGLIAYTQDSILVDELLDLIIAEGRALRGLPREAPN